MGLRYSPKYYIYVPTKRYEYLYQTIYLIQPILLLALQ